MSDEKITDRTNVLFKGFLIFILGGNVRGWCEVMRLGINRVTSPRKTKSLTKVRLNPQINQRKTGKNGKRSQHHRKRLISIKC
jgi:hypothetical protein